MRYEPSSKDPKQTGCQTGTRALALAVKDAYPELLSLEQGYGCYNRKRIPAGTTWSLHAEGRATDVGTPYAFKQLGWVLACELVQHRTIYGVMRVIWDGHIWSTETPAAWRPLQPTSQQHHDHLHVEQFWAGALRPVGVRSTYVESLSRSRQAYDRAAAS